MMPVLVSKGLSPTTSADAPTSHPTPPPTPQKAKNGRITLNIGQHVQLKYKDTNIATIEIIFIEKLLDSKSGIIISGYDAKSGALTECPLKLLQKVVPLDKSSKVPLIDTCVIL